MFDKISGDITINIRRHDFRRLDQLLLCIPISPIYDRSSPRIWFLAVNSGTCCKDQSFKIGPYVSAGTRPCIVFVTKSYLEWDIETRKFIKKYKGNINV